MHSKLELSSLLLLIPLLSQHCFPIMCRSNETFLECITTSGSPETASFLVQDSGTWGYAIVSWSGNVTPRCIVFNTQLEVTSTFCRSRNTTHLKNKQMLQNECSVYNTNVNKIPRIPREEIHCLLSFEINWWNTGRKQTAKNPSRVLDSRLGLSFTTDI